MNIETATVVGVPSVRTWSQVVHTNEEDAKVVVLQLACSSESDLVDLPQVGGELLEGVLAAIPRTASLKDLQSAVERVLSPVGEGIAISLLSGHFYEGKLFLWGTGDVACYLLRSGEVIQLANGTTAAQGVSGPVAGGDSFLFSTKKLAEACDPKLLREVLGEGVKGAELLTQHVLTKPDSSAMAAVVVQAAGAHEVQRAATFSPKKLFLRRELTDSQRKVQLIVGVGLTLLLVVLIGAGYVKREKNLREQKYAALSQTVESKLSEAQSQAGIDSTKASGNLGEATAAVKAYLAEKPQEPYLSEAKQLQQKIATAEQAVFQVYPVTLSPLLPLSILSPSLTTTRMAPDGRGDLLFADGSGNIIGVSTKDKSKFSYSTAAYGADRSVAAGDTGVFGLTDKGVVQILPKQTTANLVIQPDELWGNVVSIDTFAGNVYLLDMGNSEIWKYPVLDTGFGTRKRWLAAGISPDLSKVIDMRVTGDVWLLTSSGKLLKYTRGAPQKFSLAGFPSANGDGLFANPMAIDVRGSTVYVLESGAGRVDVFQDDGTYVKQYTAGDFTKATDIAAADGKMYVLVNNGVEWFGL